MIRPSRKTKDSVSDPTPNPHDDEAYQRAGNQYCQQSEQDRRHAESSTHKENAHEHAEEKHHAKPDGSHDEVAADCKIRRAPCCLGRRRESH